MVGIVFLSIRRSKEERPEGPRQSKANSLVASSPGSQQVAQAAAPAEAGKSSDFRALSVLERKAILADIRGRPLRDIFDLWQRAGAVEKDLMKQGAIATTMAYALREQTPPPDFLDEMWRYVVDSKNSLRERGGVLGMFGGAKTAEGMGFLIKASKNLTDLQLRRIALDQIAASGDLRADGSYHEERSPPAEKIWQNSLDPDLLQQTAMAIGKIGAPSGINALLDSALDDTPANSDRRRIALDGLEQVYSRNAAPPVAALLVRQTGANEASALATKLLVNIGDESAAKVLTQWFQEADASVVELAASAVARTRTPVLLHAWKASIESNQAFRSEKVRVAIARSSGAIPQRNLK